MVVESFKLWTPDEVINQINTGLAFVSNPFQIKEPSKHFAIGAVDQAVQNFKSSSIDIEVREDDGYTIITAKK